MSSVRKEEKATATEESKEALVSESYFQPRRFSGHEEPQGLKLEDIDEKTNVLRVFADKEVIAYLMTLPPGRYPRADIRTTLKERFPEKNFEKIYPVIRGEESVYALFDGEKKGAHIYKSKFGSIKWVQNLLTGKWNETVARIKQSSHPSRPPVYYETKLTTLACLKKLNLLHARAVHSSRKKGWRETQLLKRENGIEVNKMYPMPLSQSMLIKLFLQALNLIIDIHKQGVLHLDIKIYNMIYDFAREQLALIDFDFAQMEAEAKSSFYVGTTKYASPKALCDRSVDFYALALSFAEFFDLGQPGETGIIKLSNKNSDQFKNNKKIPDLSIRSKILALFEALTDADFNTDQLPGMQTELDALYQQSLASSPVFIGIVNIDLLFLPTGEINIHAVDILRFYNEVCIVDTSKNKYDQQAYKKLQKKLWEECVYARDQIYYAPEADDAIAFAHVEKEVNAMYPQEKHFYYHLDKEGRLNIPEESQSAHLTPYLKLYSYVFQLSQGISAISSEEEITNQYKHALALKTACMRMRNEAVNNSSTVCNFIDFYLSKIEKSCEPIAKRNLALDDLHVLFQKIDTLQETWLKKQLEQRSPPHIIERDFFSLYQELEEIKGRFTKYVMKEEVAIAIRKNEELLLPMIENYKERKEKRDALAEQIKKSLQEAALYPAHKRYLMRKEFQRIYRDLYLEFEKTADPDDEIDCNLVNLLIMEIAATIYEKGFIRKEGLKEFIVYYCNADRIEEHLDDFIASGKAIQKLEEKSQEGELRILFNDAVEWLKGFSDKDFRGISARKILILAIIFSPFLSKEEGATPFIQLLIQLSPTEPSIGLNNVFTPATSCSSSSSTPMTEQKTNHGA